MSNLDRYGHDPEWTWSEDYAVGTFQAAGLTGLLAEVWGYLPWELRWYYRDRPTWPPRDRRYSWHAGDGWRLCVTGIACNLYRDDPRVHPRTVAAAVAEAVARYRRIPSDLGRSFLRDLRWMHAEGGAAVEGDEPFAGPMIDNHSVGGCFYSSTPGGSHAVGHRASLAVAA